MLTNLVILAVALTNYIQTIQLPIIPCNDQCIMSGYFDTKDTNNLYGISIEALTASGETLTSSWVSEHYVPPMTETASIFLPPNSIAVRCTVFGPNLDGKWSDGLFRFILNQPALSISHSGTNATVTWDDPYGCWALQSNAGAGWTNSAASGAQAGSSMFRLKREFSP